MHSYYTRAARYCKRSLSFSFFLSLFIYIFLFVSLCMFNSSVKADNWVVRNFMLLFFLRLPFYHFSSLPFFFIRSSRSSLYYIYESNLAVENYKRGAYSSFLYFDAKKKRKEKSLIEIKKKKQACRGFSLPGQFRQSVSCSACLNTTEHVIL